MQINVFRKDDKALTVFQDKPVGRAKEMEK